ncbi:MAG: hypothetical protein M3Q58_15180 [Bacteroidota bacterium]|nr:hypothetical protein [Bacteroidota bacterium]
MEETSEVTQEVMDQTSCNGCGSILKFKAGTFHLSCEHCGAENEIQGAGETVVTEELDYEKFINESLEKDDKEIISSVSCTSCGASITLKPNITSDACPFCDTSLVLTNGTSCSVHKPQYLLPFNIDNKQAVAAYTKWVKGLWWAPNDLKRFSSKTDKLNGVYTPYWTYDAATKNSYTGERGDYYYVNQSYTTTENGKTVTKTKSVRKTRWSLASGNLSQEFDDILIIASHSLPKIKANKLIPWDLQNLSVFNEQFLQGFRTESYQVDVKEGLDIAKGIMNDEIKQSVKRQIGGDEQRIYSLKTSFQEVKFKHILLPVWISAFMYNNKVYRFLINGRTGLVQGERPYSWIKISSAVFFILSLIVLIFFLMESFKVE